MGNMNRANMNSDTPLRGETTQSNIWVDINILHRLEEKILCLPTKLKSTSSHKPLWEVCFLRGLFLLFWLGGWLGFPLVLGCTNWEVAFTLQYNIWDCNIFQFKYWKENQTCIIKPTPSSPQPSNSFLNFQELLTSTLHIYLDAETQGFSALT